MMPYTMSFKLELKRNRASEKSEGRSDEWNTEACTRYEGRLGKKTGSS